MTENLSIAKDYIESVTNFMKRQKKAFTTSFFDGVDTMKMNVIQMIELNEKYQKEWKEKEDALYKQIADSLK